MTGDFRYGFQPSLTLAAQLEQLTQTIGKPCYGVLGNHDALDMVGQIEAAGVQLLINECVELVFGGSRLKIAGVDDHHHFRLANIDKALGTAVADVTLLLNHSPEQFVEAAMGGVDVYLAGHTHGGQLCLPFGLAPKYNISCTRAVGRGRWSCEQMQGYTSRGIGTTLVDVRFNCPPEIVVHELQASSSQD